ncbi:MAG: single-stranded DNA-binding protein [Ruminococcus sp.]|nr:single-stranded DNA-binding protein [Ruminococcus sp.]MCM1381068.1 single-stranded DNA-binding protein [Muribaculaceae bacterium]MCM1478579.1 single-stranded DNA-binding protein [Muribaculaceae bacterium]
MHNHVILTGRLTHTPELRQTPAGIFVCTISLAVQRKYNKNKAEQEADFIEVETWRGTAEFVSKYFDKGDMIDITGRLKTSRWKDENNVTHYKTSVLAESVDFAPTNNRKSAESSTDGAAADETAAQDIPADFGDFEEIADGDLPF